MLIAGSSPGYATSARSLFLQMVPSSLMPTTEPVVPRALSLSPSIHDTTPPSLNQAQ
jgi:hypothetical protein